MEKIKFVRDGSRLLVFTPFSKKFVEAIKLAGGRWDALSRAWAIDVRDEELVRSICRDIYGCDDRECPTCSVRVRLTKDISRYGEAVTLFNRIIAKAWGRDSGAKVGDGVVFIEGKPTSGGSMKNWNTQIAAGSEFIIRDVPISIVEKCTDWEDDNGSFTVEDVSMPTVEIEPRAINVANLLARKAELMAELAQIDAELEVVQDELQDND